MSIEEMTLWVASKRSRWAKIEFDNDRYGDGKVKVRCLVGDIELDVGQSINEINDIDLVSRAVNRLEDLKAKVSRNIETIQTEARKA